MGVYNLMMGGSSEHYWNVSPTELEQSRIFEYTDESLKAAFLTADGKVDEALFAFPCLFCYEFPVDAPARVGWITKVQYLDKKARVHFRIDEGIEPIPAHLFQSMRWELQIEKYEQYRTHWAVKNIDLIDALRQVNPDPALVKEREISQISAVLSGELDIGSLPDVVSETGSVFISYSHTDTSFLEGSRFTSSRCENSRKLRNGMTRNYPPVIDGRTRSRRPSIVVR